MVAKMNVSSQDYCHSPSKNIQKHNNAPRPFLNLLFPYGHSQNWITTPPPPSHKELLKTTPLSCCSANPQALRMKLPCCLLVKIARRHTTFLVFRARQSFSRWFLLRWHGLPGWRLVRNTRRENAECHEKSSDQKTSSHEVVHRPVCSCSIACRGPNTQYAVPLSSFLQTAPKSGKNIHSALLQHQRSQFGRGIRHFSRFQWHFLLVLFLRFVLANPFAFH